MITPFDLILILIVFSFVLFGLWFGLVHALGGLIGTLAGAIVAIKYYARFAATSLGQIVAFIVLFALGSRIVGFIFLGIERLLRISRIIPGIKTIDRLAGGILGLAEGVVVVGITLVFALRLPFPALLSAVQKSDIAAFLIGVGTTVLPLFPTVLRQVREAAEALPE